jgi:hypothetical protein
MDQQIQIIMYTRRGCHLCEDAWQLLVDICSRFDARLKSVDVDGDTDLARLHGERVPVIAVNGKVCCWGRINRVLLERELRAALNYPEADPGRGRSH